MSGAIALGQAQADVIFSSTIFWEWFKLRKPAIDHVYQEYRFKVLALVRKNTKDGDGLHLAADGSFDSCGYSALTGKAVMVDLYTKLVIHTSTSSGRNWCALYHLLI
ncbi:hypothetical protein Aduo_005839 [Ancylostoma duodenale]